MLTETPRARVELIKCRLSQGGTSKSQEVDPTTHNTQHKEKIFNNLLNNNKLLFNLHLQIK
jgi:hypothetical protein